MIEPALLVTSEKDKVLHVQTGTLFVSRARCFWFQRVDCPCAVLTGISRRVDGLFSVLPFLSLSLRFSIDGMAPYVGCWRRVLSGTNKDKIQSSAKPLVVAT